MPVSFEVNGPRHDLDLDARTTLLDALREHLKLTGTKKGCDHGQCGACAVLVNGERINSCQSLAVQHTGHKVTTIERLGTLGQLHPMQAAFIKHDGYQCGYCTPGQFCSAVAVLDEIKRGVPSHAQADIAARPRLSNAELRERMSGNICRCGAYCNIAEAVAEVAGVCAGMPSPFERARTPVEAAAASRSNTAKLLAGSEIQHYGQAIALIVAETFELARAAALILVDYARVQGRYDLAAQKDTAALVGGSRGEGSAAPAVLRTGDLEAAFTAAPVKLDATYSTPDQRHQMMEPHASIAT